MSLTIRWPAPASHPTQAPRRNRVAAAIGRAGRAGWAAAKQVGRAVLVLAIFAMMLAAAMALGLLIWVPHFHGTP